MPEILDLHVALVNHLLKTKKQCKWDLWYVYQNELDKACFQL